MEAALNPEQKKAVEQIEGPVLILAGAGSGKTRVITYRIAHMIGECGIDPRNILALTFTNKAAGEMRQRVDDLVGYGAGQIWVSTFHSTCVRILRRHADLLGYEKNFTIYDSDDSKTLMKEVFQILNIDSKYIKEKAVLASISNGKNEMMGPEEYARENGGSYGEKRIGEAYLEYQKRLRKNNAMDFDDLIFNTIVLFREHRDVLAEYQQRFRYIMVDEYQDTNTAQFQLISLLANYVTEEGEIVHNLCVVGDDDQSIYRFRGANIQNILSFEKKFPGAMVIKLEQNYRSTQTILDAANEVIRNNGERKEKRLWTQNQKGDLISYCQYENEYEEAEHIVEEIDRLHREEKASYQEMAILYRTNAQSRIFEEKFNFRGIPYDIVNGHTFYERREIKDLLGYLMTLDNPTDDLPVRRIINVPKRGIGLTTIDRIMAYGQEQDYNFYDCLLRAETIPGLGRSLGKIQSFVGMIESLRSRLENPSYTLLELIREIIEETGYVRELEAEGTEEAKGRIANIDELVNIVAHYEETAQAEGGEAPTLSGLMEQMKLNGAKDTEEEGKKQVTDPEDKVLLMTLHTAKGLEFPYVFLCGFEDGIFPGYLSISSDDPADLEEERRLCYVGITRAKVKLYLSAARFRMVRGETQVNRPSRFLEEIPRYLISQTPGGVNPRQKKLDTNHSTGLFSGNPMIGKGLRTKAYGEVFEKPRPATGELTYQVGDRVTHVKFGSGLVKKIEPSSGDYEVEVDFQEFGTKRMMASFARLIKE